MKFISKLLLIALVQAMYGCAAPPAKPIQTPTGKMYLSKDPMPLLEQVRSGAIGINDWQPAFVYESVKATPLLIPLGWTPLCAAIAADDTASVSTLLQLGASVKQPCNEKGDNQKKNPLEFSMWIQGLKPNAEKVARLLIAKGAVTRTGKVSEAELQNSKVQNVARYNKLLETSLANSAQIVKEMADKKEAKEAESKESFLSRDTVMGIVAIAGATANNYASMKNNTPPVPSLNNLLAQPSNVERGASVNSPQTQTTRSTPAGPAYSGQACGPDTWCTAGDGYAHWCSGPPGINPSARSCESECIMSSGVFYHDTRKPNNVAYIPGEKKCSPGCTVPNPCSN